MSRSPHAAALVFHAAIVPQVSPCCSLKGAWPSVVGSMGIAPAREAGRRQTGVYALAQRMILLRPSV